MVIFLSGVNEIIIKRVGRWSSKTFLEYNREQVDSFTAGVSQKMLENENFHHLNDKEFDSKEEDETKENSSNSDGVVQHIPFDIHYSKSVLKENIESLFSNLSM